MKNQAENKLTFEQVSLRDKFLGLSKLEQEAIGIYFNLYNAAAWHYNEVLTEASREYVEQSIKYAREVQMLEDQTPDGAQNVQEFVDNLNSQIEEAETE